MATEDDDPSLPWREYQALCYALRQSQAVGQAHHLLIELTAYVAPETGEVSPAIDRLAEVLAVTPARVQALLAQLITGGDLQRVPGQRGQPARYRFPVPDLPEPPERAARRQRLGGHHDPRHGAWG
jgi:hypothetical protein